MRVQQISSYRVEQHKQQKSGTRLEATGWDKKTNFNVAQDM